MHWSEEIAQRIIERKPDKEEYVCAAGISPSGSIHIGNFRDVATSYFVVKALRKMGKKAKLLFSWDEFDRLRKVPVNVQAVAPELEACIGMPYVDVKNPFPDSPCKTYAEHFEQEFERSIGRFGIKWIIATRRRCTAPANMRSRCSMRSSIGLKFLKFLTATVRRRQPTRSVKIFIR